jgi:hypothetical protein
MCLAPKAPPAPKLPPPPPAPPAPPPPPPTPVQVQEIAPISGTVKSGVAAKGGKKTGTAALKMPGKGAVKITGQKSGLNIPT